MDKEPLVNINNETSRMVPGGESPIGLLKMLVLSRRQDRTGRAQYQGLEVEGVLRAETAEPLGLNLAEFLSLRFGTFHCRYLKAAFPVPFLASKAPW